MRRLLLCTDMDRTLLPNGAQPESANARKYFSRLAAHPNVSIAYVTGRHLPLVQQAISEFMVPTPDYVISDVGTRIYHAMNNAWEEVKQWRDEIAEDWRGKNHVQLSQLFTNISEMRLQEPGKQSEFKLSYYVSLDTEIDTILATMEQRLKQNQVDASLIWSIDEPNNIGLLDVLPRNATKRHAVEFLGEQLNYNINELIFAGDSGNDLPVIASKIHSILVANASPEIKQQAQILTQQNHTEQSLYIAKGGILNMNGNYAAGIVEGVCHYMPEYKQLFEE